MGVMVYVLIGLGALALALIVVPRVSRARRAARPATVAARPAVAVAPAVSGLDDEWDDELGWVDVPPRVERTAQRGDGATASNGAAPAVTARDHGAARATGFVASDRGIARFDDAGGSAAVAAREYDPRAPLELEDDDWQVPPPPVPARPATSGDGWARGGGKRRRGPLGSPVVMLALYSLAGIALIVLAVNLSSGSLRGGDTPQAVPAADRRPVAPAPGRDRDARRDARGQRLRAEPAPEGGRGRARGGDRGGGPCRACR